MVVTGVLYKMPTKYYGALTTKADIAKVEAEPRTGIVEVLCKIESAKRIDLSAKDWGDIDMMARKGYCDASEYEARKPLSLSFREGEEPNTSGAVLTDAFQIKALLDEYGVEKPEDLIGQPVLVYKPNVAKPGQEPLGAGTLAFSRPE